MAATSHGPFPDISDIARLARAKLQRAQGSQAQPQTAKDLRRAYDVALADIRAKFTVRLDGIIAQVQASAPDVPIATTKDGDRRTYAVLGETLTLRHYDLPPKAAAGMLGSAIKIAVAVAIYRRTRAAAGQPRRLWDPALGKVVVHALYVGQLEDATGSWLTCTLDEQRFVVQGAPLAPRHRGGRGRPVRRVLRAARRRPLRGSPATTSWTEMSPGCWRRSCRRQVAKAHAGDVALPEVVLGDLGHAPAVDHQHVGGMPIRCRSGPTFVAIPQHGQPAGHHGGVRRPVPAVGDRPLLALHGLLEGHGHTLVRHTLQTG